MTDVVELARTLVRLDTAGRAEEAAAHVCGGILEAAGARVELVPYAPGRAHLLAFTGDPGERPLVLSGHLDTVPVGDAPWARDPFSGDVSDGVLHGRGSADMKGGVAALVVALERFCARGTSAHGVVLVLSAAEETGCAGSRQLVLSRALPGGGPLLVAEPTDMRIATGHKGVLWLRVSATGRSAHGSRPDLGENAITPLARLTVRLADEGLPGEHPVLGRVTANVGTISGGTQINLVPDAASAQIDIRLVPGADPQALIERIRAMAGADVRIETLQDLPPVYSSPDAPFAVGVREALVGLDRPPLTYFTDAAILAGALRSSETVLLGPGDPDAAHTTDESCPVEQIRQACDVYERVIGDSRGRD